MQVVVLQHIRETPKPKQFRKTSNKKTKKTLVHKYKRDKNKQTAKTKAVMLSAEAGNTITTTQEGPAHRSAERFTKATTGFICALKGMTYASEEPNCKSYKKTGDMCLWRLQSTSFSPWQSRKT